MVPILINMSIEFVIKIAVCLMWSGLLFGCGSFFGWVISDILLERKEMKAWRKESSLKSSD